MRDGIALDGWLFFAVVGLLALGIIMVLSTSYLYSQERFSDGTYFFRKQLIAAGAGMTALFIVALVPPAAYRRLAYPLLLVSLLALILVLVPGIGVSRGGARRWLPLGGFVFQPVELAKLSLVLYLAQKHDPCIIDKALGRPIYFFSALNGLPKGVPIGNIHFGQYTVG